MRDMLVRPGNVPKVDHKFEAMVVWMSEEALVPGKQYLFKQTSKVAPGAVGSLRYRVDINTLHRQPAPTLARTSRTFTVWPVGAPFSEASALMLRCVLAMHTGRWP